MNFPGFVFQCTAAGTEGLQRRSGLGGHGQHHHHGLGSISEISLRVGFIPNSSIVYPSVTP